MRPPATALSHPIPRPLTLASVGLGFFVLALDSLLLTAGGPNLAGELRGLELVGWLFTAYLLMWTVTGPLFGKLSDIHGRRPILVVGLAFYALGALLAAQAQSMEQVIGCRLIQGIGAGAVGAVSLTAAGDLFPPHRRARGQMLYSASYLIAAVIAPPLAGLLVGNFGWRAIFVTDAVLAVFAAVCLALTLREQIERRSHQFDLAGAATLVIGAGSLMLALAQASREGTWTAPSQLVLYALACLGTLAFIAIERRVPEPLVPLALFRSRVVAGSFLVTLSIGACIWAYSPFVPLFIQGVLDGTALQSAVISLAVNLGSLLTSMLSLRLLWRWGYRTTSVVGMAALVAAFAMLALIAPGELAYPLILGAMFVQGLGLGFANTAALVAVQNAVPWEERGTATAGVTFFRSFGPSLVISVLQVVLNARVAAELAARGVGLDQVGGASQASALLDPALRASVPPATLESLRGALEVSLYQVYWLIAGVALLGCLAALLLPGGSPERHVWREEARSTARPSEAGS